DADRNALYEQGRSDFEARYRSFVAGIDPASLNYAALPHGAMMARHRPPSADTLAAAVQQADLIVVASVQTLQPVAFGGTYVTVLIHSTLKRCDNCKPPAFPSAVVHQASHLGPTG